MKSGQNVSESHRVVSRRGALGVRVARGEDYVTQEELTGRLLIVTDAVWKELGSQRGAVAVCEQRIDILRRDLDRVTARRTFWGRLRWLLVGR